LIVDTDESSAKEFDGCLFCLEKYWENVHDDRWRNNLVSDVNMANLDDSYSSLMIWTNTFEQDSNDFHKSIWQLYVEYLPAAWYHQMNVSTTLEKHVPVSDTQHIYILPP